MTKDEILKAIEEARRAGELSSDQARAASLSLGLEGDEAMLACRLFQGADPASLEYLLDGVVSEKVELAHRCGPGIFTPNDLGLGHYLTLCALSANEAEDSTLRDRVLKFLDSIYALKRWDRDKLDALAEAEMDEIKSLPYETVEISGRSMRLYRADLGFAAAYWSGEKCAALFAVRGSPYFLIGCAPGATLDQLGIEVEKTINPSLGVVETDEAVRAILETVS